MEIQSEHGYYPRVMYSINQVVGGQWDRAGRQQQPADLLRHHRGGRGGEEGGGAVHHARLYPLHQNIPGSLGDTSKR